MGGASSVACRAAHHHTRRTSRAWARHGLVHARAKTLTHTTYPMPTPAHPSHPSPFADDAQKYIPCVGVLSSLANHSCAPSAAVSGVWDSKVGAVQLRLYATRALEAGEEVTTPYVSGRLPPDMRRLYLANRYGFTCACARCALSHDDTVVLRCARCGHACHVVVGAGQGSPGHKGELAAACAACGHAGLDSSAVRQALAARDALQGHLLRDSDDDGHDTVPAPSLWAEELLCLLHPSDAVRISANQRRAADALADCEYAAAAVAPACEAAACLLQAPWAGHRARFYACLEAGDACGLVSDGPGAAAWFRRAIECMAPFATDAGTPLMAAVMQRLQAAAASPPASVAAASELRESWAALEEALEDDDF